MLKPCNVYFVLKNDSLFQPAWFVSKFRHIHGMLDDYLYRHTWIMADFANIELIRDINLDSGSYRKIQLRESALNYKLSFDNT